MSELFRLLPDGYHSFRVDKAEKDVLKDGREILILQLLAMDDEGIEHRIYDVIETQETLDQFLISIGYPPGSMKLNSRQ